MSTENKTEYAPTEESIKKLSDLIKDIKFCMLTTKDDESEKLFSRPMYAAEANIKAKELWFFTRKSSWKCEQIEHDRSVNVAYSEPSTNTFVSIAGKAKLSTDQQKIKDLWREQFTAWFPKGLDDPEVALIRVDIEGAEYWDTESSRMVFMFRALTTALFKSEPYKPTKSENLKVDFTGNTVAAE
jgi:general stress protein 26